LALLTQKVYEGAWEAINEQQLIRLIESKIKEFYLQAAEKVKQKVKSIDDAGVFSFLKN
jgi:hypothetical protein